MDTERPSPRYSDIDVWDPSDIAEAMIEGQFTAVAAVRAARVALVAQRLPRKRAARRRPVGLCRRRNLGSIGGPGRRRADADVQLAAGSAAAAHRWRPDALLQSVEGAEDAVDQAARLVDQHGIGIDDVVIAVAASGGTPFTLSCLREARRWGALTIGIANNRDTPILQEADHPIWLDTGAEPIAGSTRMKASTA